MAKERSRAEAIRVVAYLFLLFFVLPVLLIVAVFALTPLIILFVLLLAFAVVFTRIPWTPPEFSLATEAVFLALYELTKENFLREVAESIAARRREFVVLDREDEIQQALEQGDVRRALRVYVEEITKMFVGSTSHAKTGDRGDD